MDSQMQGGGSGMLNSMLMAGQSPGMQARICGWLPNLDYNMENFKLENVATFKFMNGPGLFGKGGFFVLPVPQQGLLSRILNDLLQHCVNDMQQTDLGALAQIALSEEENQKLRSSADAIARMQPPGGGVELG
tara:strand:- start:99 stop:497 length:399 start_codon:yes stop_codon:yes gene_type:complete